MRGCSCRGTAGFAHVSCLAEQAKILFAEAEENNLDAKALNAKIDRWCACSLCEQRYHGVVQCALGWACWKTYLGRPEADQVRHLAISVLGNGLDAAAHHEDALSVREAELSLLRRVGVSEPNLLMVQNNLGITYEQLKRHEEAMRIRQGVYSARVKLFGEEHIDALGAASNYALTLNELERFAEAKSLMRKTMPAARRVLGGNHVLMLMMRQNYALALYRDNGATLDDFREAVNTFEDLARIARRVLGGSHPLTTEIEQTLQKVRAALRARETTSNKTTIYFRPRNSLCRFGFCFGASVDPYSR